MRKSIDVKDVSFSGGVGLSVPFYGRQQGGTLPNVDVASLRGYGADVPLLVGWESAAGLYKVWAGARGGWEHVTIGNVSTEPRPPGPGITLEADRFFAGGVLGLAVGFRHVHVGLELNAAYSFVSGRTTRPTSGSPAWPSPPRAPSGGPSEVQPRPGSCGEKTLTIPRVETALGCLDFGGRLP